MAFSHSKTSRVLYGTKNVSCYLKGWSTDDQVAMADATTLCDTANVYIEGLADGSVQLEGLLDDDGTDFAAYVDTQKQSGVDLPLTIVPAGFALGAFAVILGTRQVNFSPASTVTDLARFTLNAQSSDGYGVDYGISLADLTARTSNASGSSNNNSASSANGGVAQFHCTASDTTLNVKVEHSANDSTWADLAVFTELAATTGSQRIAVTGTVNQYLRATWTVSGGAPSATFQVSFARN